jgi:uncharacterized protein
MSVAETPDSVIVERGVWIPMRDGVRLQADLWRPAKSGTYPILLQRTPYNRADSFAVIVNAGIEPLRAVEDGFVVVIPDTRGRFGSEGVFDPFRTEAADGYDTIQWLADQGWSNGRVGMYGASYYAATQLLAATAKPPALRAIAPQVTAADYHDDWVYRGGALQLGFTLYWALGLAAAEAQRRTDLGEDLAAERAELKKLIDDPWTAFRTRPLSSVGALRVLLPAWEQWLSHPQRDDFWTSISIVEHFGALDIPALHIGGWFDIFLQGTIANFTGLKANDSAAEQRLLIGPWAHAVAYDALGEVEYGASASAAAVDMTSLQLEWFSSHLKPDGPPLSSAVARIFVMGANQWRDESDWPPPHATTRRYYLGSATSTPGLMDGQPDLDHVEPDVFEFNPANPVPTVGGATFLPGVYVGLHSGQRDQRSVEKRPDVLSYSTAPLTRDLEICGPVSVTIWAATTARDTDWTAKLVDVYPDGRALNVCDGIIRARYANPSAVEQLVPSGEAREYRIDLGATALRLSTGHALRIEISSSNFPRFDVNPGYAGEIAAASIGDLLLARQQVFHDPARPSYVELSVITPDSHSATNTPGANHVTHRQD